MLKGCIAQTLHAASVMEMLAQANVLESLRISLGKRHELTEHDVSIARSNSLLVCDGPASCSTAGNHMSLDF